MEELRVGMFGGDDCGESWWAAVLVAMSNCGSYSTVDLTFAFSLLKLCFL